MKQKVIDMQENIVHSFQGYQEWAMVSTTLSQQSLHQTIVTRQRNWWNFQSFRAENRAKRWVGKKSLLFTPKKDKTPLYLDSHNQTIKCMSLFHLHPCLLSPFHPIYPLTSCLVRHPAPPFPLQSQHHVQSFSAFHVSSFTPKTHLPLLHVLGLIFGFE